MSRFLSIVLLSLTTALGSVVGCGASYDNNVELSEPFRFYYTVNRVQQQAQFFDGAMPDPNGGPDIVGVDITTNRAVAGTPKGGSYSIRMPDTAYATAIRVLGRDSGYWIARVGQQELLSGAQVSTSLAFDIAPDLAPGPYTMEVAGIDSSAHFGARTTFVFTVLARTTGNAAAVISLKWDALVDLDLQVIAPDGTMTSPKNASTAPPGTDAGAASGYGVLSADSIASCVEDGYREEDLVFSGAPLPGTYKVYVNPFSMCGSPGTNYEVQVFRNGVVDPNNRYFGSISALEVQQGGFQLGDHVADVTF